MNKIEPGESSEMFESRKQDHIRLALDRRTQAEGLSGFDFLELEHEALPDFNFSEISTESQVLGYLLSSPLFISSMTAGNELSPLINKRLFQLASTKNILMAVGSQRKELTQPEATSEWLKLKEVFPNVHLMGNFGIAQVIGTSPQKIKTILKKMEAVGVFIHLNPLQEVIQPEGTPHFRGGFEALKNLRQVLDIPIAVKEVGCGISTGTRKKLEQTGIDVIDIAGKGGTHWGRVEGLRSSPDLLHFQVAQTFWNWGLSTAECLKRHQEFGSWKSQTWASGGVRNGLDAVKCLVLGAKAVGVAAPFLKAALESEESLSRVYDQWIYEMKVAMFCTGVKKVDDFALKKVCLWK